jgi:hypothetical protein
MENLYPILPFVAAAMFIVAIVSVALGQTFDWKIPAAVSLSFLAWSLFAVAAEGSSGFWTEHTRSAWGNQIFFDLLIAGTIAWSLLVPRSKMVDMRIWLWLVLVAATGCIGLAAMFARCRYLETRTT